jgi:high-affinity iron transporter
MLLNSVILVLREVLQAALIFSVFLGFLYKLGHSRAWVLFALMLGIISGYFYASNVALVTDWLEGRGQELLGAVMHLGIYLLILLFMLSLSNYDNPRWRKVMTVSVLLGSLFSSLRESAEVILYSSGFIGIPSMMHTVLMGGLIGASIGICVGILFYYLFVNLHGKRAAWFGYIMLLLLAGNTLSQFSQLLMQADLLPTSYPVWDSSSLISEHSMLGQLLFELFGYEATPSRYQVSIFVGGWLIALMILLHPKYNFKSLFKYP